MMDEMPVFKNATCRGSYLLRSACGHCERCEWEMEQLRGQTLNFSPEMAEELKQAWKNQPPGKAVLVEGDKEETMIQDLQWLLNMGPRGERLVNRVTAIVEDNINLCDQMDAVVKALGEDPDSFDAQWAHVHVAKLMAGLPYEPTDAMISSVSGVVGPYAAKKIWQRMCDIARRTAPIEGAAIANLERALVEVAFGMHREPQYMLMKGLSLIDNDRVRFVLADGTVVNAASPTAPPTEQIPPEHLSAYRQWLALGMPGQPTEGKV